MDDKNTSRPPSTDISDMQVLVMRKLVESNIPQEKSGILMQGLPFDERFRILCGNGCPNVTQRSSDDARSHPVVYEQQGNGIITIDKTQSITKHEQCS